MFIKPYGVLIITMPLLSLRRRIPPNATLAFDVELLEV